LPNLVSYQTSLFFLLTIGSKLRVNGEEPNGEESSLMIWQNPRNLIPKEQKIGIPSPEEMLFEL
jgi:hypothetical protein